MARHTVHVMGKEGFLAQTRKSHRTRPSSPRYGRRINGQSDLYQLDAAALRSHRQPLPSYHPLPLFPDTRIHFEDISTSRMRNANMQDDDGALNLHLPGLTVVRCG
ncbi:hypothetical protein PAXRUDRAFT_829297 [Paxillus rubicundulus Ve08.2h10]|uniref:Uncharacterized protein n=1 Tax=Paxillus rubicundulus Ve08.2h10 TaxID=930991 RepID=A0A0D0D852_9AGAM|nr:hypothetical protein PAXRUDRAFT_829297 [Paxillus rubicundulus Ve08.2h10]